MSIRFDASSDKLERTTGLPSGAFTMMGWFKMSVDRGATSTLFGLGTSAGSQFYSVEITSARKLECFDGDQFPSGSTTLVVGTWYHIALTRASGAAQALTAYLNGSVETSIASSQNLASRTFMDVCNDSDSEWVNGCAAHIKIWDAALTATEVQQEMYTIRPQMTANLHLWTPTIENGTGARNKDYSGNGRDWTENGTLTDEDGPPVSWGAPVWLVGKPAAGGVSDLSVSVSDSITVAETVSRLLEAYINKSDSITVAETVNTTLAHNTSVSDAVTVSETLTRLSEALVSKSEAITVAETLTLLSTALVSVTDAVAVAEAVTLLITSLVSTTDAVAVSETVNVAKTYNASVSDSVAVAETVTRFAENYVSVSEAVAVAEALTELVTSFVSVSESVTVSEAVSLAVISAGAVSVSDSVAVAEATTVTVSLPVALADNLAAYYPLEDVNDSLGINNLTNSNSVTFTAGKVANAGTFASGSSKSLAHADAADFDMGDIDFTITAWVKLTTKPAADMAIVSKFTTTGNQRGYVLQWDNTTDRFNFVLSATGSSTVVTLAASTFGAPSTATFYFLAARYDAAADLMSLSVNAGTVDTAAQTGGAFANTAVFAIGRSNGTSFFNGQIDEVGLWKRKLSDAEITDLYNGGSGRDYTYISTASGISINVSDAVALTESVTLLETSNISKTESVTVAEALAGTITGTLNVSVIDSVNISGGPVGLLLAIQADDGESVSVSLVTSVSASDAIALTEATGRLVESFVSKSESITVAEAVTPAELTSISVTDSIAVSESISIVIPVVGTSTVNVNDSITVSEATTATVSAPQVSVTESVSVAETVTPLVTSFVSNSDSVTVAETVSRLVESYVSKSESITLAEATVAAVSAPQVSVTDAVVVAEAIGQVITPLFLTVADAVSVSESASALLNLPDGTFAFSLADGISIGELVQLVVLTMTTPISRTLSIGSENRTKSIGRENRTLSIGGDER